ncbi:MAG: helix-hairpin-helix domain-containing protein [bacterium]|nr:helix-hairpin-helix domain-containing protein [bacterium]
MNKEIAKIFTEMAGLLEIKGDSAFRINANKRVARILETLPADISVIYKEKGIKGFKEIHGIGESSAKKIEEYIKKGKIKSFNELQEETSIRQLVTHFFKSKGLSLQELKENAKKRKIIYSRFTKPAKQLLELAQDASESGSAGSPVSGSLEKAKQAIDTVAAWANSRKLDYTIETVFKKWLELDRLKPKEIVKKPFYNGDPMVYSEAKRKWYVISKQGEWLLFADKESAIEWKTID